MGGRHESELIERAITLFVAVSSTSDLAEHAVEVVEAVSRDFRSRDDFVGPAVRLAAICLEDSDPPLDQDEAVKLAVESFILGATYGLATAVASGGLDG
jgi:hypothetical protein